MERQSTSGDDPERTTVRREVGDARPVLAQHTSMSVPAKTENLATLRAFARDVFSTAGVPETSARHMVLAVDEAVTSIIHDAAESARAEDAAEAASDSSIDVTIDVDSVRMLVVVRDTRTDFTAEEPDKKKKPDESQREGTGGDPGTARRTAAPELGIFLMRQLLDEVNYTFRRGFQNHLELLKFLY